MIHSIAAIKIEVWFNEYLPKRTKLTDNFKQLFYHKVLVYSAVAIIENNFKLLPMKNNFWLLLPVMKKLIRNKAHIRQIVGRWL